MPPEEIREKLAAFMGWEPRMGIPKHRDEKGSLVASVEEPVLVGWWDGELFHPIGSFRPDIDRNQVVLVLEKVADNGIIDEFINRLMATAKELEFLPCCTNHTWFALLALSPKSVCKAIISVKEENPTP